MQNKIPLQVALLLEIVVKLKTRPCFSHCIHNIQSSTVQQQLYKVVGTKYYCRRLSIDIRLFVMLLFTYPALLNEKNNR